KVSVLKAGGLKAYRKGIPLFVGLTLGEFVVGGAWSIVGTVTGWHTYRFWAY
ncbi:MAG: hypothetical protein HYU66_03875, partial [Armatimonadetes bacterium]|nr:hypothetical protein [Armatimonadota bacterium]